MQEQNRRRTRLLFLSFLCFVAALARLLPHPPNFTPVGALALFGGARFERSTEALWVPITAMVLSDAAIHLLWGWGFGAETAFVYIGFLAIVALGIQLRKRRSWTAIGAASLAGSILFFAITNFGVWALGGLYPHDWAGLATCYLAGVPFFGNTVAGDLFYNALLFGAFALAQRRVPGLSEPTPRAMAR